ncbi:MAG: flippase-like domain-containing protein [Pyrinomonadaceae bacterium MAG19_C2-C3]|nr:flippase-like domain-containing protein [Pyrinomonadaceae bacterium MAG19_C2-C3]
MRSHLKTFLLLTVVVAVLIWFGRKLDWVHVWSAIGRTNKLYLALAIGCICLTYLIRAFRWRVFLAPFTRPKLGELFAATTVGFGALFIIGRAGELMRPAFLSLRDKSVPPVASFITIAIERIFDSAAMILLFSVALMMMRVPQGSDAANFERIRAAGFLLLGAAIFGTICLFMFRLYAARIINWFEARTNGGRQESNKQSLIQRGLKLLTGVLRQLDAALGVLTDRVALAKSILWTVVLWAVITFAIFLTLRAFALPLGVTETIFVMGCSLVGSLVPTPGGAAGAYEAATAGGLYLLLTIKPEDALAVALVLKFVSFAPALFFGLYYFMTGGVRLNRLRAATHADEPDDAAHIEGDTVQSSPGDNRVAARI